VNTGSTAGITGFLRQVRRLDWTARTGEEVLKLGSVTAVLLTLNTLLTDRIPGLPWLGFAVGAGGAMVFWFFLSRVVMTMTRPLSLVRSARRVEAVRPEFQSDISSSLGLEHLLEEGSSGQPVSRSLVRALIGSTGEKIATLHPGAFVTWRPVRTWALRLAGVALPAAVLLGSIGFSPSALRALVDPVYYWPLGKTTFAVSPGAARMVRGGELPVEVKVSGPIPGNLFLEREENGGEGERTVMGRREGAVFFSTLAGMRKDFRYRVATSVAASTWFSVEVVEPPTAGNFEASYTYPAYAGLESRTVTGSGNLETLRGTSVRLEFTTNKPLAEGKLFLGENEYEITTVGDRRYSASFYLNGEENYRIGLVDGDGFTNLDPLTYEVRYLPDGPPEVELLEPRGEVDPGSLAQIAVAFRASDDYGVSRLSLVYRDETGREVRERIFAGSGRSRLEEEYYWDVGALSLTPGSAIPVFLEAVDNDSITGPKTSLSDSFLLRVPDAAVEHQKTEESLDELVDDLVDFLADSLDLLARYEEQEIDAGGKWEDFSWEEADDSEEARRSLKEKAEAAENALEALEEQMYVDPLTQEESLFQLGLIKQQLDTLQKMSLQPMEQLAASIDPSDSRQEEVRQKTEFLKKYAEEVVRGAEQMALMAEEMQQEQKMADLKESGLDMMDLQEEILKGLEDLSAEDREGIEEVLKSLEEMEKMMGELMEELSKGEDSLPQEFLNSDALSELPLSELAQNIKQIRDMIAAGDMEGAKKAAADMLKNVAELLNRLREAGDEFENRAEQAIDRLKEKTIPELEKLVVGQRRVLEESEELARKARSLKETAAREDSSEGGGGGGEDAGKSGEGDSESLAEPEQSRSQRLSETEGALKGRADLLADETAALKGALPFLDPEIEIDLRGASGDMGKAEGLLAENSPGSALGPERAALAQLMEALDRAGRSLRKMNQMQSARQGKGGMSPRPGGNRRGDGMPSSFPSRSMRSGGRFGTNMRSFRIPGKEDDKASPIFRQEILKSLREGYPARYEERIKGYFHRITE
jgi:hypothetical protein